MKIALVRDVKIPSRGTGKSAGLDFYVPMFDAGFQQDFLKKNMDGFNHCHLNQSTRCISIRAHGKAMIPLGIKLEVPEGYALIAFNKTGVSWNHSILNLSAVVDEDYQGELFLTITNYSDDSTSIYEGQKIIQLLAIPVQYVDVEVVAVCDLHSKKSERGEGALGSTGRF